MLHQVVTTQASPILVGAASDMSPRSSYGSGFFVKEGVMDMSSFAKASVAGVPLVLAIIGLTEWFKSFKKKDGTQLFAGNALLLISMAQGLVLGGGYMLTQTRPPVGDWWTAFGYWFAVWVYGLVQGLVASGIYEVARGLVEKIFGELIKKSQVTLTTQSGSSTNWISPK